MKLDEEEKHESDGIYGRIDKDAKRTIYASHLANFQLILVQMRESIESENQDTIPN